MRNAGWKGIAALLLLGACSGNGCVGGGDAFRLDLGADTCVPAGGTCYALLGCDESKSHADLSLNCPSFVGAVCCLPGVACETNKGTCERGTCGSGTRGLGVCPSGEICCAPGIDYDATPPFDGPDTYGTCDGNACLAGCACEPGPSGAKGVCDCGGPDAGSDASIDGPEDAASSPDGASDAATDAAPDADAGPPPEACGALTCRGGCVCADPGTSACVCP